LSLKLIVDEDSLAKPLIKMLKEAGHNVVTVNEVNLNAQSDLVVLNYARQNARIVLTHNCRDFKALHLEDCNHPGILAIYRDADSSKNMSRPEIVRAIANLEVSEISLSNRFVALNHWNY
jgi:predicted nuclease of predicted toxin-antitoxin system